MDLLCDAFPPFAQEAVGAFFFLVLWFGKRHLLLVGAILVGEEYDDVGTFSSSSGSCSCAFLYETASFLDVTTTKRWSG